SETERDVTAGGWAFHLDAGVSYLFAPRVPLSVRDRSGRELVAVEPPPAGVFVVAVVGARPASLEERLEAAVGRPVRVESLYAEDLVDGWRAYDLFDLVLVARTPTSLTPAVRKALVDWAHAGGRVAATPPQHAWPGAGGGLGWFGFGVDADALLRTALGSGVLVRPRLAPSSAVRRDLYRRHARADPEVASDPLERARAIVLGGALASAGLLWLGARVRVKRGLLWAALVVANVAGAGLGLLLPPELYREEASGRIEVVLAGGGYERVRTYHLLTAVAGRPEVVLGRGWAPVLADDGAEPWWKDARGVCPLRRGRLRIFLEEEVRVAGAPPPGPGAAAGPELRPELGDVASWTVWEEEGRPPSNAVGPPPLVRRLYALRQR
ncbi:MAG: hypothetical protein ACE5JG_12015, partial [Planctomycetota bacterium]